MIISAIPKLPYIDKQETLSFYLNQLGFNLITDYGDYFLIKREGAELHFFKYPDIQPHKSDFMIYLRMDTGIDELYEQCRNIQPRLKRIVKLEVKPWHQKEFALIDPNGTLLTFGQPL